MKKLILISLLLIGCNGVRGTTATGARTSGTFTKCEFEGHDYIIYKEGFAEMSTMGLAHDPNCKACKLNR